MDGVRRVGDRGGERDVDPTRASWDISSSSGALRFRGSFIRERSGTEGDLDLFDSTSRRDTDVDREVCASSVALDGPITEAASADCGISSFGNGSLSGATGALDASIDGVASADAIWGVGGSDSWV